MVIFPNVKKSVVFVGAKVDGEIEYGGTAFLVGIPAKGADGMFHPYLVTAKHNIEIIKKVSADKQVVLRVNGIDGKLENISTPIDGWKYHPTEANNVDAAVMPLINMSHDKFDFVTIPDEMAVTPQKIKDLNIEEGEEVFIVGLFRFHYGTSKNYPIVRVGNIALFPEEKVQVGGDFGAMDAYLIESRSIKGLSGSPVFVNLDDYQSVDNVRSRRPSGTPITHWLGLIHGHWETTKDELDFSSEDVDSGKGELEENMNVGISIVVPAKKILEIINIEEFKQIRKEVELKSKLRRIRTK